MPGSHKSGGVGNPSEDGLEDVVIQYLRRCEVCGVPFLGAEPRTRFCHAKTCHAIAAEFEDFLTLRWLLRLSRWTSGKSQKQLAKEYYRQQLREAIEQLPQSADPLYAILCEIIEDLDS